ncbi:DUF317 domain-containing protein [Streptomyces sp. NPDC021020]|uniref:DUF317 domain-containing protein n=1 Tax=Streptomyces sp. NPDC021020 TaxID=3365109 RepID=UPI00379DB65A
MPYTTTDDPWAEYLVSPRYLAGSSGTCDAGFAPVAHWPHRSMGDGPCQLLVTSPDGRIRIGWFGDDFELWKICAATDAVSAARWTATFNHVTPAEIVAGLTGALARDYAETDPYDEARFLTRTSMYWADAVRPLTDAGWTYDGAAERGTVEIVAPDQQAGALIDNRLSDRDDRTVQVWAGPPGWGTRAEATFTSRTPSHLIAATAAAMTDPAPAVRERHTVHRAVEHLVTLTPVRPPASAAPRLPTPLDVRHTAVTRAVERAARGPYTATDLRVRAARNRSTIPTPGRTGSPTRAPEANPPITLPTPSRRR